MKVFNVYKTDNWHSYISRDLLGIAESKVMAIQICNWQAQKEGEKFDEDQLFNLNNIHQTQGYSGEGEFHFEEIETNKLI